jgi:hypothetical protein
MAWPLAHQGILDSQNQEVPRLVMADITVRVLSSKDSEPLAWDICRP